MRKIFPYIIFVIFLTNLSFGQRMRVMNTPKYDADPYHFGFSLGFNKMDFSIHNSDNFWGLDSVRSVENRDMLGFQ